LYVSRKGKKPRSWYWRNGRTIGLSKKPRAEDNLIQKQKKKTKQLKQGPLFREKKRERGKCFNRLIVGAAWSKCLRPETRLGFKTDGGDKRKNRNDKEMDPKSARGG